MRTFGVIQVLAGDFRVGESSGDFNCDTGLFKRWRLRLGVPGKMMKKEAIGQGQIESVELAGEEQTRSFAKGAALGVAGALALGPVGLIAGALSGSSNKSTFIITLKDGRRAMCISSSKVYAQLQASQF